MHKPELFCTDNPVEKVEKVSCSVFRLNGIFPQELWPAQLATLFLDGRDQRLDKELPNKLDAALNNISLSEKIA